MNVEDVQQVARRERVRKLTQAEIERVQDTLGDIIPWRDLIGEAFIFLGQKEAK